MEKIVRGVSWNTEIVQDWTFEHFKNVISTFRKVDIKLGIDQLIYENVSEEEMKKDFTELTGREFEPPKKKSKKDLKEEEDKADESSV